MKLRRYISDNSNEACETDELWFDGYHIGERQLEGLPIRVIITNGGMLWVDAEWPQGLDIPYWINRAIEFAKQHDVFSTTKDLNNDDGFIEHDT